MHIEKTGRKHPDANSVWVVGHRQQSATSGRCAGVGGSRAVTVWAGGLPQGTLDFPQVHASAGSVKSMSRNFKNHRG